MMLVHPADRLPCPRRLLQQDFQHLGEGSTVNRLQWLEQMECALSAQRQTRSSAYSTASPSQVSGSGGLLLTKQSNLSKTDHST